jgi:cytochrome c oxidase subunit 4
MSTHVTHSESEATGSPALYVTVFIALVVLTIGTAVCSRLGLGRWEVLVALAFAITKAALVTLFFMHLLQMARLNWVIVAAGLLWLSIAITLTMADYLTRSWYSINTNPSTAVQTLQEVEREIAAPSAPAAEIAPAR